MSNVVPMWRTHTLEDIQDEAERRAVAGGHELGAWEWEADENEDDRTGKVALINHIGTAYCENSPCGVWVQIHEELSARLPECKGEIGFGDSNDEEATGDAPYPPSPCTKEGS